MLARLNFRSEYSRTVERAATVSPEVSMDVELENVQPVTARVLRLAAQLRVSQKNSAEQEERVGDDVAVEHKKIRPPLVHLNKRQRTSDSICLFSEWV